MRENTIERVATGNGRGRPRCRPSAPLVWTVRFSDMRCGRSWPKSRWNGWRIVRTTGSGRRRFDSLRRCRRFRPISPADTKCGESFPMPGSDRRYGQRNHSAGGGGPDHRVAGGGERGAARGPSRSGKRREARDASTLETGTIENRRIGEGNRGVANSEQPGRSDRAIAPPSNPAEMRSSRGSERIAARGCTGSRQARGSVASTVLEDAKYRVLGCGTHRNRVRERCRWDCLAEGVASCFLARERRESAHCKKG